jgi:hypothetical protein
MPGPDIDLDVVVDAASVDCSPPPAEIMLAMEAWKGRFGDPRDPAVRQRIMQAVEDMLPSPVEAPATSAHVGTRDIRISNRGNVDDCVMHAANFACVGLWHEAGYPTQAETAELFKNFRPHRGGCLISQREIGSAIEPTRFALTRSSFTHVVMGVDWGGQNNATGVAVVGRIANSRAVVILHHTLHSFEGDHLAERAWVQAMYREYDCSCLASGDTGADGFKLANCDIPRRISIVYTGGGELYREKSSDPSAMPRVFLNKFLSLFVLAERLRRGEVTFEHRPGYPYRDPLIRSLLSHVYEVGDSKEVADDDLPHQVRYD